MTERYKSTPKKRGTATVEFVLVMPSLILVVLGMLALGNYLLVRHHLVAAATNAARFCAISVPGNNFTPCATVAVRASLPLGIRARCAGDGIINAGTQVIPGSTVRLLRVDVQCVYQGFASGFMAAEGVPLGVLRVSGAMPIPNPPGP